MDSNEELSSRSKSTYSLSLNQAEGKKLSSENLITKNQGKKKIIRKKRSASSTESQQQKNETDLQTPQKSKSKRLMTPIKISNEYLAEPDSSTNFIISIEQEIEALRTKRLTATTIEDEEFKLPQVLINKVPETQFEFKSLFSSGLSDLQDVTGQDQFYKSGKWPAGIFAVDDQDLEEVDDSQVDVDVQIGDLFSGIYNRTRQLHQLFSNKQRELFLSRNATIKDMLDTSIDVKEGLDDDDFCRDSEFDNQTCRLNDSMTTVVIRETEEGGLNQEHAVVSELLRDLQSKHVAEKRILQNDISAYQSIIKRLVQKLKMVQKQKQKQDISLVLMKKVQESHKNLKQMMENLTAENLQLSQKFGKMKQLVMQYELNRIKQLNESEEFLNQLKDENQSLRQVIQIGKEFYQSVDESLKHEEEYEMPLKVQQKLLDRIDEVQARSRRQVQNINIDEDDLQEYNEDFNTTNQIIF